MASSTPGPPASVEPGGTLAREIGLFGATMLVMGGIVGSGIFIRTLRWESTVVWRSDRDHFYYTGSRRLLKDGVLVREKAWDESMPRDHQ